MNVEFKLPELGENVQSGDVVSVLVREGDQIAANDGVIELETDKAVVEIPCPYAGKITKVQVGKGQTIKVGQPLLMVEAAAPQAVDTKPRPAVAPGVAKPQAAAEGPHPSPLPKGEGTGPAVPAGPAAPAGPEARRLARELGVDLARVRGERQGGADHRRGRPRGRNDNTPSPWPSPRGRGERRSRRGTPSP